MISPLYCLTLPRPLSWAAAAGIYTVRLPWAELVRPGGLCEPMQHPAWILFHTSIGPGDNPWHKVFNVRCREAHVNPPKSVLKGGFTGMARLERVEAVWDWPSTVPAPQPGEVDEYEPWKALFLFSKSYVLPDQELAQSFRDPRSPLLWHPNETLAQQVWAACEESRGKDQQASEYQH